MVIKGLYVRMHVCGGKENREKLQSVIIKTWKLKTTETKCWYSVTGNGTALLVYPLIHHCFTDYQILNCISPV